MRCTRSSERIIPCSSRFLVVSPSVSFSLALSPVSTRERHGECPGNERSRQCLGRPPSGTAGREPLRGSSVRVARVSGFLILCFFFIFFFFVFSYVVEPHGGRNSLDIRENRSERGRVNNIEILARVRDRVDGRVWRSTRGENTQKFPCF